MKNEIRVADRPARAWNRGTTMERRAISTERGSNGVFRDYVRGVLADHSRRSRALRARRMFWLRRVGQQASSPAEERWENEGGSMW